MCLSAFSVLLTWQERVNKLKKLYLVGEQKDNLFNGFAPGGMATVVYQAMEGREG